MVNFLDDSDAFGITHDKVRFGLGLKKRDARALRAQQK